MQQQMQPWLPCEKKRHHVWLRFAVSPSPGSGTGPNDRARAVGARWLLLIRHVRRGAGRSQVSSLGLVTVTTFTSIIRCLATPVGWGHGPPGPSQPPRASRAAARWV